MIAYLIAICDSQKGTTSIFNFYTEVMVFFNYLLLRMRYGKKPPILADTRVLTMCGMFLTACNILLIKKDLI